jgi:hypothetical protein
VASPPQIQTLNLTPRRYYHSPKAVLTQTTRDSTLHKLFSEDARIDPHQWVFNAPFRVPHAAGCIADTNPPPAHTTAHARNVDPLAIRKT